MKDKIYKKLTANYSKSYFVYSNKLVDEYNNNYHCSTGEKPIHADYSTLSEEMESSHKATKFKVVASGLHSIKRFLAKVIPNTG